MEANFKTSVNSQHAFEISAKELEALDLLPLGSDRYHILNGNKAYKAEIIKTDFNSRKYTIKINKGLYEVQVGGALDQLIEDMGFELSSSKTVAVVEAPMPGLILQVEVKEGQQVEEGDPLLVLEAMKMENVITSPRDGVIKKVPIAQGDTVDKKQVLIEFE